jgi:hypothetical protein
MAVQSPELIAWNREASEFLWLSACDQELYIAAVNAGASPEAVLALLTNDCSLEALSQLADLDLAAFLMALPSETIELAGELACSVFGF